MPGGWGVLGGRRRAGKQSKRRPLGRFSRRISVSPLSLAALLPSNTLGVPKQCHVGDDVHDTQCSKDERLADFTSDSSDERDDLQRKFGDSELPKFYNLATSSPQGLDTHGFMSCECTITQGENVGRSRPRELPRSRGHSNSGLPCRCEKRVERWLLLGDPFLRLSYVLPLPETTR